MLVDSLNENEIIVYLSQYTIVIGKHQDVLCECKVDEFIAKREETLLGEIQAVVRYIMIWEI